MLRYIPENWKQYWRSFRISWSVAVVLRKLIFELQFPVSIVFTHSYNFRRTTLTTRRWSVLCSLWQQGFARSMGILPNFACLLSTNISCGLLCCVSLHGVVPALLRWVKFSGLQFRALFRRVPLLPIRKFTFSLCCSSSVCLLCVPLVCLDVNYGCHPRLALLCLIYRFHVPQFLRPAYSNSTHVTSGKGIFRAQITGTG